MSDQSYGFASETENSENSVTLGKCWAAIRGAKVVGTISMSAPNDINFDEYRSKAVDTLGLLGEVKSGEMIEREGHRYFVPRISHPKLRKKPVKAKEYPITHPHVFSGRPVQ